MDTLRSELKDILKGRVTIIGMGNIMRGDDGFGPALSSCIEDRISADVINAGLTPENYLKEIRESKPDTILLVDAADFRGLAGEARIFKKSDIPLYGLSTHNVSPVLFLSLLETDTKAHVYMLAVQPERTNVSSKLSAVLKEKCEDIESLFLELLPKNRTG
jgi:hydrogenase 3 maturation protease